jgi:hypothetical protein
MLMINCINLPGKSLKTNHTLHQGGNQTKDTPTQNQPG